jgi:L-lysine exporter family protein LysE/ArgO
LEALIHGVILAFGLILPLGVQNVFVFTQGAVQPSFVRSLPVVITAAICDTLLILLAVLGVSVIVLQFAWLKTGIFVAGFIFLLYMGWSLWRSQSVHYGEEGSNLEPKKQILFAASVSLLNPHAIIDTIGVIGTSSLGYTGNDKWLFTVACVTVSWCWFIGLAVAGRMLRSVDTNGIWLRWQNKVSAVIIWLAAFYIGWQALQ